MRKPTLALQPDRIDTAIAALARPAGSISHDFVTIVLRLWRTPNSVTRRPTKLKRNEIYEEIKTAATMTDVRSILPARTLYHCQRDTPTRTRIVSDPPAIEVHPL